MTADAATWGPWLLTLFWFAAAQFGPNLPILGNILGKPIVQMASYAIAFTFLGSTFIGDMFVRAGTYLPGAAWEGVVWLWTHGVEFVSTLIG